MYVMQITEIMHRHGHVVIRLNQQVFFSVCHCSWQRGSIPSQATSPPLRDCHILRQPAVIYVPGRRESFSIDPVVIDPMVNGFKRLGDTLTHAVHE